MSTLNRKTGKIKWKKTKMVKQKKISTRNMIWMTMMTVNIENVLLRHNKLVAY